MRVWGSFFGVLTIVRGRTAEMRGLGLGVVFSVFLFPMSLPCEAQPVAPQETMPAASPGDPKEIGIDTEPGLRIRLYWIGRPMEFLRPLAEGQSPNVDETITEIVQGPDQDPFADGDGRSIDRQYVLHVTGWVHARRSGEYEWNVASAAAVRVLIDGKKVIDVTGAPTWQKESLGLDVGWHTVEIFQYVNEPAERFMDHTWKTPGEERFAPIGVDRMRAPAFHFRPTQPGKKLLKSGANRPGLGMKLGGVHPGYRLTNIRPEGMEMPVGALGMLSDGTLVVARFDAATLKAPRPTGSANGELWLLRELDQDDPELFQGEKIADGLFEPSGICVLQDVIYVSQREEISRFELNESTKEWKKSVVASGWETNDFHQLSAGLLFEPGPGDRHPGFFYMARSPGLGLMKNPPDHGSIWRVDLSKPAGENVTPLTGGHRTPNGLGYGPKKQIFVVDNQGEWTPASELNHVQEGSFYGFYHPHDPPNAYRTPFQPDDQENGIVTQPAILLPQDEIGNSPTQPLAFPGGHRFAGQLALPDMRYGGINRVFLERVEGVWQGCAMRFTQGLEAGPNRILFGPDGSLYVGGIGGSHASTWYWVNPEGEPTFQGLERLTPTGKDVFEIEHLRATSNGFSLTFTQPVPLAFLSHAGNFKFSQWTYRASIAYGGAKIDVADLSVERAVPSRDRRGVNLIVPGLKVGHVVHLRTDPGNDAGQPIWSGEVWYTLNRIPKLY